MNNIIESRMETKRVLKTLPIWIAFIWGLAESSLFFIVPDVWLTIISRYKMGKTQYWAIGSAILGALVGGTIIYYLAQHYAKPILDILTQVPGINQELVSKVQTQIENKGLLALMLGPLQGIPYKIYAAQWGIINGSLFWFWIISIPARGIRFIITAVLTRLIWFFSEARFKLWHKYDLFLLLSFWVVFYIFYFQHFRW